MRNLIEHEGGVWSVAFASGGILASGSEDKTIRIWNVDTGDLVETLEGHNDRVYQVALDSNSWLASASKDKTVKIWGL